MLSQFIGAVINQITMHVMNAFTRWGHVRFYFVAVLIFLLSLGLIYREVVTETIQTVVFNEIKFRECRDVAGLTTYMDKISKQDTIIDGYSIYLYEPINNSTYKRLVITTSKAVMKSPALQGIYLNTQPTVNKELIDHDYYLANYEEMIKHEDTRYWADFGHNTRLCYALKLNGKVIGEVWIEFKADPAPLDLEKVLKDISPIMFNYII